MGETQSKRGGIILIIVGTAGFAVIGRKDVSRVFLASSVEFSKEIIKESIRHDSVQLAL